MDVETQSHEETHSVRNTQRMALALEVPSLDANQNMNQNSITMINLPNTATIAMRMRWISVMENEATSAAPRIGAPSPNLAVRHLTPNFLN